jgi:hypothetical protein
MLLVGFSKVHFPCLNPYFPGLNPSKTLKFLKVANKVSEGIELDEQRSELGIRSYERPE